MAANTGALSGGLDHLPDGGRLAGAKIVGVDAPHGMAVPTWYR